MATISRFLRHHHRRRHLHFISHPILNPIPNPPSSSFILLNRSQPQKPSLNRLNSSFSLSRSFSWTPWGSYPPTPNTGSDSRSDGSESGQAAPDLGFHTPDLGIPSGSSWVVGSENELDSGSGLASAEGSGNGLEGVVDMEESWLSPVRALTLMMDSYHDVSGLPWWLVISTSVFAFRVALVPLIIFQLKKVERIKRFLPKLPPLRPPPQSGRSFREQYLLFRKKRQELGCPSYLWSFASVIVQVPCFLLGLTTVRRMCLNHHHGFDNGGILWFQDLTDLPRGLLGLIFPLLIASLHSANVQISFKKLKVDALPTTLASLTKYYRLYLDVLAIPFLLIGLCIPQGSLVFWLSNSSLSLIQQLVFKNPHIRNKLGLTEENVWKKKMPIDNVRAEEGPSIDNVRLEKDPSLVPAEALTPEKLLDLSLKYVAAGHLDNALPLLRAATEKDPELVRALVATGQILCSKKSYEEAAEYFERAISKIQPEEGDSHLVVAVYGAGVSRIWQGKKAEGIEHLKRLAELKEPDDPIVKANYYTGLVMLGSVLFQNGEKTEAARYLRIAAAYDPGVNAYLKECEEE